MLREAFLARALCASPPSVSDRLCTYAINATLPASLAERLQTKLTYLHRRQYCGHSEMTKLIRLLMKRAFSWRPSI